MVCPKIYLDNCCYNRPFDCQSQIRIRLETEAKLYIQAGIREKRYTLIWSYMLDFENENNPYTERKRAIAPWKEIADEYCSSSDDILSSAREIASYGVHPHDALHIACAIKCGCTHFITTDKDMLNKKMGKITIINPIDFIVETED